MENNHLPGIFNPDKTNNAMINPLEENLMSKYEPYAPSFSERIKSAELARDRGFTITFSIEPALDNPIQLIEKLAELSDEIWLGIMNPIWKVFHSLIKELQN